jgi:DNA-binding transcriptional ArsR family regulator
MKKKEFDPKDVELSKLANALSHPVRVYILKRLNKINSCCTSGDMIEELPIARSTLSQHLKELKYAGLIQGEIELPKIRYCLNQENWEKARELFAEFFDLNK